MEMHHHDIARLAHEANRAYCKTIGDDSQPAWEKAPGWARESALDGVQAISEGRIKRPEDSHQNWLDEKTAAGWVYGEKKDPEKKQHPCMVAYDQLPEEQQVKDAIFFSVVSACLVNDQE